MDPITIRTYAREEWKNNCRFHPHSEKEIFHLLETKLNESLQKKPVLLLDLDSTLYEVAPRTHAIINDWVKSSKGHAKEVLDKLAVLETQSVGYSLRDTFKNIGLSLEEKATATAWEELKMYWQARFFTSDYLSHDKPYKGAAHFARKAHDTGVFLVYLTGREETPMLEGTVKNLIRDQFPWDTGRTALLMRHSSVETDLEHKKLAVQTVKKTGTLIASFENEPLNLVALFRAFPESMHVFMDSVASDHPAEAIEGIYRIKSFSHYFEG